MLNLRQKLHEDRVYARTTPINERNRASDNEFSLMIAMVVILPALIIGYLLMRLM